MAHRVRNAGLRMGRDPLSDGDRAARSLRIPEIEASKLLPNRAPTFIFAHDFR